MALADDRLSGDAHRRDAAHEDESSDAHGAGFGEKKLGAADVDVEQLLWIPFLARAVTNGVDTFQRMPERAAIEDITDDHVDVVARVFGTPRRPSSQDTNPPSRIEQTPRDETPDEARAAGHEDPTLATRGAAHLSHLEQRTRTPRATRPASRWRTP